MEEGQGFDSSQGQEGTGGNPAWSELLSVIPQDLHEQVQPHLQKWDQNYQTGIQKVHSQYEGYKPFVENGIAPEQMSYALQLLDQIETNPQQVMEAMQQYLLQDEGGYDQGGQGGYDPYQEQQGQNNDTAFDLGSNPQFSELQQMVSQIAQVLVQQNQDSQAQQEDAQLDQELTSLRETKGDFDENWVLSQMMMNPEMELGEAVDAYHNFVQGIRQGGNMPGPKVLGSGSSLPQGVRPSQMDDKGRRSLVAQMLQQTLGQGQ